MYTQLYISTNIPIHIYRERENTASQQMVSGFIFKKININSAEMNISVNANIIITVKKKKKQTK